MIIRRRRFVSAVEQWQLVGLITQRSVVRIRPAQLERINNMQGMNEAVAAATQKIIDAGEIQAMVEKQVR